MAIDGYDYALCLLLLIGARLVWRSFAIDVAIVAIALMLLQQFVAWCFSKPRTKD